MVGEGFLYSRCRVFYCLDLVEYSLVCFGCAPPFCFARGAARSAQAARILVVSKL